MPGRGTTVIKRPRKKAVKRVRAPRKLPEPLRLLKESIAVTEKRIASLEKGLKARETDLKKLLAPNEKLATIREIDYLRMELKTQKRLRKRQLSSLRQLELKLWKKKKIA